MNLQLKSLLVLLSALEVASASQRILRNEATIVHDDEQVDDAKKHVPTATTQLDEERGLLSIESVKIDQEPCDEGLRETAGTELTLTPTTDVRRPSKCPCPTALPYVIYLLAHTSSSQQLLQVYRLRSFPRTTRRNVRQTSRPSVRP